MAQETKNVAAFSPKADGGIYYAPRGTALPVDASSTLAATFKPLGYVTVDGVSPANDESSSETIRAWGGDIIAELVTEKSIARYDFTLVEVFSKNVNEFAFGADNTTVTPAAVGAPTKVAIADKGIDPENCVLVFDMIYKGKLARIVIPDSQNRVTGGNAFVHTSEAGWSFQATCMPDSSGVRQHLYFENDDALTV